MIFYLLGVFVISQGFGNVITPWPVVDQLALIVKGLIFMPSFLFLALYAAGFGAPISIARRALIAIAIALAAAATVRGVVVRFELWNGSISPFTPALLIRADPFARLFEGAVILAVMLWLLAALSASRGVERTRLLWALAALGAFVLVEWALTGWLGTAGHTANVLVSGGVALALGLSIRFVHGRVDRVIDNVFFRRRHEMRKRSAPLLARHPTSPTPTSSYDVRRRRSSATLMRRPLTSFVGTTRTIQRSCG